MTLVPGKIVCVGRNYAAHAAEMGVERPVEPILFFKPPTALLDGGGVVTLPSWSDDVHHEVELVVRIGAEGRDITASDAHRFVDGWGVGVDLTARDVQTRAKELGHPWAVAKGFDGSAPVSDLLPVTSLDRLSDMVLELAVSGEIRQQGSTSAMLWTVRELVAFASSRFTLARGDLLFTGTPEGVGPVVAGDRLVATVAEARLEVTIAP
ncbi:MAG: fumarylacetoacetate hydrolase family protein [Planctomycetes bacterium]|nr:fumarylacetoacetate hydrolase family protein [Planctomycetota bacterium]